MRIERGLYINRRPLRAFPAADEARVSAAIGFCGPGLRAACRRSLLDSMIHDINLMRGLLGEPTALRFANVSEAAISVFLDFAQSSAVMHWINLQDGVARYRQEFAFFSPRGRATLVFPSPFLRSAPTE